MDSLYLFVRNLAIAQGFFIPCGCTVQLALSQIPILDTTGRFCPLELLSMHSNVLRMSYMRI